MPAAKWLVRDGIREFIVDIDTGRVRITDCHGPFGIPVAAIGVSKQNAAKLAKAIRDAGASIKASSKGKS